MRRLFFGIHCNSDSLMSILLGTFYNPKQIPWAPLKSDGSVGLVFVFKLELSSCMYFQNKKFR